MTKLTDRQRQVFDCIQRLIAEKGYPPSIREIGRATAIRSTNGVSEHLAALERKGWIERDDARARGIRVTGGTL
jgi:repressor LexA